ncbi:hypothetical protein E3U23_07680 [Erythrobacter litoralis]|uniref:hypothetical protein n=1 Tax=Erythrobacter litoralis TaxID=39960 RepID=UPI002435A630|nr:hypothetical protein [Erythrobacter litoralis]MDG6079069.1 hypothetical protein [Erythrobacter litoralis]
MRYVLALTALAFLAACGDPVPEDAVNEPIVVPPRIETSPSPALTPAPTALVPSTIDSALRRDRGFEGELGCVFRRGQDVLLVGVANDASRENAEALIVIDGEPQDLRMDGSGGYNALSGTPSFAGPNDLQVDIDVISEASDAASESELTGPAPLAATMNLARGGQSLSVEGIYECGPQSDS